jgi:hypothetical protein
MWLLFLILFSTAYVIVPPFNQDICFYNTFREDVSFDLIYSNPLSMNKITSLGYIAQCISPNKESHCNLVKEERTQDYSVKVYNCFDLYLEQELAILLDDTDNYQTKNIIAVIDNDIIALARQYYLSSSEELSSGESSSEEESISEEFY